MRRAWSLRPITSITSAGGPDEDQSGVRHRAGERSTLGQEAVAGVDRLGAGLLAGAQQSVDRQVRLRGAVWGRAAPCRRRRARAERPGRRPTTRPRFGCPAAEAARMTRSAISPRLATSREPKGLACKEKVMASHPEDAVGRFRQRCVGGGGEAQAEHPTGVGGLDHTVVPQPARLRTRATPAPRTGRGSAT